MALTDGCEESRCSSRSHNLALSRRCQVRIPVTQNDLIDEVAALHAAHGHEPIPSQALSDIHATFFDQKSPSAKTMAGLALNSSIRLSGFSVQGKDSCGGGVHTVLFSS